VRHVTCAPLLDPTLFTLFTHSLHLVLFISPTACSNASTSLTGWRVSRHLFRAAWPSSLFRSVCSIRPFSLNSLCSLFTIARSSCQRRSEHYQRLFSLPNEEVLEYQEEGTVFDPSLKEHVEGTIFCLFVLFCLLFVVVLFCLFVILCLFFSFCLFALFCLLFVFSLLFIFDLMFFDPWLKEHVEGTMPRTLLFLRLVLTSLDLRPTV
jgi:hypothetical protein